MADFTNNPNRNVGPQALRRRRERRPVNPVVALSSQNISLELQEITTNDIMFSVQPWMDNIRGGIKPGYTHHTDVPVSGGIRGGQTVPISGGIATPFIDPPTSPLALHLGQGNVLLTWGHPTPAKVNYYELYASLSLSGQYTKYPTGEFRSLRGTIQNVPVGITIYFQLRAVGINTAESTFVQVKKGKFSNVLVPMKVRAIRNSTITAGATFNDVDEETGRLIVIRSPAEITIS